MHVCHLVYPQLLASVLIDSRCHLNALEFNGGHCSDTLVSQRATAGEAGRGLCGCTWRSRREMWYNRSKLERRLSVGKTSSLWWVGAKDSAAPFGPLHSANYTDSSDCLRCVRQTKWFVLYHVMTLCGPILDLSSQRRRSGQFLNCCHVGGGLMGGWGLEN